MPLTDKMLAQILENQIAIMNYLAGYSGYVINLDSCIDETQEVLREVIREKTDA